MFEQTVNESVFDKGIFKAVFFGGVPGAGKSYVLDKITDGNLQPRIVNFDKYAEFLAKSRGIKDAGEISQYLIDKSKQMTKNQLALYINSMLPLFVDTTSNKPQRALSRDGILKSFGYDTAMVWINTSLDTALRRARERDRSVPENFIRDVHKSAKENLHYYRTHFRLFVEVNNDDGELTDDVILKAYQSTRSFFMSDIDNPVGRRSKSLAEDSTGYLVPKVYPSIEHIRKKVSNWY